ncbi:MAG: hypothetical protein MUC49_19125 [Raineya sp.]|jgi:hypothetical protein|nr:hypothetical protein [Raineya sp.]
MLAQIRQNPYQKWLLYALIAFIIFLFLTPLTLYNSWGIWLTIFEALFCGFFVFMTTAKLNNFYELLNFQDDESKGTNYAIIPVCVVFVLIFIFSNFFNYRINEAIEKYGIMTKATIVDGESKTSRSLRRSKETNELQVEFTTKKGEKCSYKTSVSKEIFSSVSKGLEVEIKYVPDSPEIFKLMVGNENVEKFKGISNRDLEFSDLEMMINQSSQEIKQYLDSLSAGWEETKENELLVFTNKLKKEMVAVKQLGEIVVQCKFANVPNPSIPKDKVISVSSENIRNADYTVLKVTTFELQNMTIRHSFGVNQKTNAIECFLVCSKKQ